MPCKDAVPLFIANRLWARCGKWLALFNDEIEFLRTETVQRVPWFHCQFRGDRDYEAIAQESCRGPSVISETDGMRLLELPNYDLEYGKNRKFDTDSRFGRQFGGIGGLLSDGY
jgi:hypothetical protein